MISLRIIFLLILLCRVSVLKATEDDRDMLCDYLTCDEYECPEHEECDYGEVPDVCECCTTCAKGPGEQCGGMFDLAGKCMEGYECVSHPKYPQLPGMCKEEIE